MIRRRVQDVKSFISATVLFLVTSASGSSITSPHCKGLIHGIVFANGRSVPQMTVVLEPIGVGLGVMLPRTRTDDNGEYRFERVCPGRFTVLPDDEQAGYPTGASSPYLYPVLYGKLALEVKLTTNRPHAELRVNLPPKPSEVHLNVRSSDTKADVQAFTVILNVPQRRRIWREVKIIFDTGVSERNVIVPPDTEFTLQVAADGFRASNAILQIPSGTRVSRDIELEPLR